MSAGRTVNVPSFWGLKFQWVCCRINICLVIPNFVLRGTHFPPPFPPPLLTCLLCFLQIYHCNRFFVLHNVTQVLKCGVGGGWKRSVWTDHVRKKGVSHRVKEQRSILHEIRKRKANWIGHILHRKCLLQRVIEGKIQGGIEVTRRQGRRRRKLLDDLKERRG